MTLGVVDRTLCALFARHADRDRHTTTRTRYREARPGVGFGAFVARVYAVSWLACAAVGAAVSVGGVASGVRVPVLNEGQQVAGWLACGALVGAAAKRATVRAGDRYLAWRAGLRRAAIRATLPGAVRYLSVLASGTPSERDLLARAAARTGAYGETAAAFRGVLATAELTGSVDRGLRVAARDTPSQALLAPFLVKFREHAAQGPDALRQYLDMEARMLADSRERAQERAASALELVAELFVVVLVLPVLVAIITTVVSVLAPGFSAPVAVPHTTHTTTVRALLVYGSAAFVLGVGALAAWLVGALRPRGLTWNAHRRSRGVAVLTNAPRNPADTAVVAALPSVGVACWLAAHELGAVNAVLMGYVAFALPVGAVAARRARIDDAKDRELQAFVHAVAGHVGLGRPFGGAVSRVARGVDLGALNPDVDDLAVALAATTTPRAGGVRRAALAGFVERVDTQLAAQTVGLVSGALDAGSDADATFEALQSEVGRLYHEKRSVRSRLLVYVAVGWTTALLVVGITVAVSHTVLGSFTQLSAVSDAASAGGLSIDPRAVDVARDRFRFYVVTQATMLACGWFAGAASRGRYSAVLHSGVLVAVAYAVFTGVGLG
ncbi:type II secretion system F family protein [Halobacterium sp. BOL4-2]|uniref:type II secretion system F family protein n=1 Tax=Halobacterium sp. BOL4-2 TaxID=2810537 RepID=UPI001965D1E2|nr:type II secretion system F family protein [Halobacterium sp. BOL4-2]QRY24969.1 type II secretion system F family protein [Halobacterium sp. BOL4-2]